MTHFSNGLDVSARVSLYVLIVIWTTLLLGCSSDSGNEADVPQNHLPQIQEVTLSDDTIYAWHRITLDCVATDVDGDSLRYRWLSQAGTFIPSSTWQTVFWQPAHYPAPNDTGRYFVSIYVYASGDSVWANSSQITVYNGDLWNETGEPFVDEPDEHGDYNRRWDPGEVFFDLPSTFVAPGQRTTTPTTDGAYNASNNYFDEYELFTYPNPSDSLGEERFPVLYTWEDVHTGIRNGGREWALLGTDSTGTARYLIWDPEHSTWLDRGRDGEFDLSH